MKRECTRERFLENVKDHKLQIIKDDGVHRHIIMSKEKDCYQRYEIVTFPQHLCYTGDMGTFVFRRVEDMFTFFRGDINSKHPINTVYWNEKLQAVDRGQGDMAYSTEALREEVEQYFKSHCDWRTLNEEERAALWQNIEDNVLTAESEEEAWNSISGFDFDGFEFEDFWPDMQDYTYRFIWCLYAMVYAIQEYDKVK